MQMSEILTEALLNIVLPLYQILLRWTISETVAAPKNLEFRRPEATCFADAVF